VKAVVMGYEAYKEFEVYEFYQWKYEVNVSMPHYFLTTAPGISGVVVAKYDHLNSMIEINIKLNLFTKIQATQLVEQYSETVAFAHMSSQSMSK
jgi:hypothetical protein